MKHAKQLLSIIALAAALSLIVPLQAFAITAGQIIALTNQQRQAAGLPALQANPELMASANAKAQDMIARNYWAHFAPDGTSPWYFINQSGYKYHAAGENLAMDFTTDQDVMTGWMNSPSHRANILNPLYRDIGVAVVEGPLLGHDTILVVAHYGDPANQPASVPAPVTATPTPAPAAQPEPAAAPVLAASTKTVKPTTPKAQPAKTVSHGMSNSFALLKLGLAQMWLAPFFKRS